jgi:hypothetical protein
MNLGRAVLLLAGSMVLLSVLMTIVVSPWSLILPPLSATTSSSPASPVSAPQR